MPSPACAIRTSPPSSATSEIPRPQPARVLWSGQSCQFAEPADQRVDIAFGRWTCGRCRSGVRRSGATAPAQAVGQCFGRAGTAALGALRQQARPPGDGGRRRGGAAGQPRWQLVGEAAAHEAHGGVHLCREARSEGMGEVVGIHATREPCGGQGLKDAAVGCGEGQARVHPAELGQREVRGRGRDLGRPPPCAARARQGVRARGASRLRRRHRGQPRCVAGRARAVRRVRWPRSGVTQRPGPADRRRLTGERVSPRVRGRCPGWSGTRPTTRCRGRSGTSRCGTPSGPGPAHRPDSARAAGAPLPRGPSGRWRRPSGRTGAGVWPAT